MSKTLESGKSAEDYLNEALNFSNQSMYLESIASYETAIRIDPNSVDAHNGKGNALKSIERYIESIASYETAIRIDPNSVDARYNKGLALEILGKYEMAIDSYNEAIRIDPNFVDAHNEKGNVLEKLGRYADAIDSYDAAVRINRNSIDDNNNKGLTLGDFEIQEDTIYCKAKPLESINEITKEEDSEEGLLGQFIEENIHKIETGISNIRDIESNFADDNYLRESLQNYSQTPYPQTPEGEDGHISLCGEGGSEF